MGLGRQLGGGPAGRGQQGDGAIQHPNRSVVLDRGERELRHRRPGYPIVNRRLGQPPWCIQRHTGHIQRRVPPGERPLRWNITPTSAGSVSSLWDIAPPSAGPVPSLWDITPSSVHTSLRWNINPSPVLCWDVAPPAGPGQGAPLRDVAPPSAGPVLVLRPGEGEVPAWGQGRGAGLPGGQEGGVRGLLGAGGRGLPYGGLPLAAGGQGGRGQGGGVGKEGGLKERGEGGGGEGGGRGIAGLRLLRGGEGAWKKLVGVSNGCEKVINMVI